MGKKNIVVQDELFYALWKLSLESSSLEECLNKATSFNSSSKIPFKKKYGINEDEAFLLTSCIYDMAKKPFADVLKEASKTKAKASKELCVPIRTLEDWCSLKGHCPDYTRLLIMKKWSLFVLPKHMVMEDNYKPRKRYAKKKTEDSPLQPYVFTSPRKSYSQEIRELEERRKQNSKEKTGQWWLG